MNYKVISALTLGQVSLSANRRIKCSSVTVERLLLKLRQVLAQRSISYLFLLQRSKFRWQLRNLERLLNVYGITVLCLENRRRIPHGFMRAKKKPRK